MKTKLEKKYEELVKEYKRLINLSASKQFFDIPYVRSLESKIAVLKEQQSLNVSDEEKSYPEKFVEWFGKQCEYIPDEDGNALYRSNHFNKYNSRHLTLEEVYQFWNDNIKDK